MAQFFNWYVLLTPLTLSFHGKHPVPVLDLHTPLCKLDAVDTSDQLS